MLWNCLEPCGEIYCPVFDTEASPVSEGVELLLIGIVDYFLEQVSESGLLALGYEKRQLLASSITNYISS